MMADTGVLLPGNTAVPRVHTEHTPAKWQRGLMLLVGAALPLISLSRTFTGAEETVSLLQRIAPVDVIVVMGIVGLAVSSKFRLHLSGFVYLFAILFSAAVGVVVSGGGMSVVTASSAMIVAFLYFVFGYNVSRSPALTRMLVAGIAVGVCWQLVIVAHDFFSGTHWFAAQAGWLVRGTFRATGQLASYGFSTVGLLLALGWVVFRGRWSRLFIILAGMAGMFFVVAAGKRGGTIAIGCWVLASLLIGFLRGRGRGYAVLLVLSLTAVGLIGAFGEQLVESVFGRRLADGMALVGSGGSFTHLQFQSVMERIAEWFPLGLGPGLGYMLDYTGTYEIHNGLLALLVETGVLGLLGFCWLLARAASGQLKRLPAARLTRAGGSAGLVQSLVLAFILASVVKMCHGTLFRDRGFLLFLGLATGIASVLVRKPEHEEKSEGRLQSAERGGNSDTPVRG